ncbi:EthD family reductase [Ancylobacter sonchi]|uniref:EthD domain-containing protein n=1 Tax=Ancylobacter sonchi TaxID=1937790 RepID=UPI001BD1C0EA|nr:EthD domain-containing protein [Ancylobacter sonchi]MBS7533430.1 EthD family reductase [Ancylobacter sonchi]
MIKVLSMMKRKEGMSLDEFRHWLTEEHSKLSQAIPGLDKFIVNIAKTDSPDNPFDSVNELYFADEAAMQAAFGSDAGKASGEDALAHISGRSRLITIEYRLK